MAKLKREHQELELEQNEAAIIQGLLNMVTETKRKKNNTRSQ